MTFTFYNLILQLTAWQSDPDICKETASKENRTVCVKTICRLKSRDPKVKKKDTQNQDL